MSNTGGSLAEVVVALQSITRWGCNVAAKELEGLRRRERAVTLTPSLELHHSSRIAWAYPNTTLYRLVQSNVKLLDLGLLIAQPGDYRGTECA